MMKKILNHIALVLFVLALACTSALAQRSERERGSLSCNDDSIYSDSQTHCEIKEQTLAATGGTVNVDGRENGGVAVKGWERNEILVRYRIQSHAPTQEEADQLASQIRVETAGAQIHAEGPERHNHYNWEVTYEVFVPFQSNLSLEAHNGGIVVSDVRGRIDVHTTNGGVVLKRVGGSVHGGTTNGGLVVDLNGSRWDGEGLDVKTTNGGVVLSLPDNYSAFLETGTVNGNLVVSPSIAQVDRRQRELSTNVGSGGAPVRIYTTNGGVVIKQKSSQ
ncbi:MAG: hypothetical protein AUG51_24265 [Acidobacteria bacterium 13_1_20CM_3_53_8]|nr:MAG: hypothetical protein AUG51_24265 [Acidobacteria bacterium 13_1_20CM_3_53_8]